MEYSLQHILKDKLADLKSDSKTVHVSLTGRTLRDTTQRMRRRNTTHCAETTQRMRIFKIM